MVEAYSGPIAHPAILAGYEQLCEGSAKKIIELYEIQVHHRVEIEKTVIRGDNLRANWGLAIGAVFGFSILAVAAFLVHTGHDTAGIAFIGFDFAAFGGAFFYGAKSRRKEREAKEAIKKGGKQPRGRNS